MVTCPPRKWTYLCTPTKEIKSNSPEKELKSFLSFYCSDEFF